MSRFNKYLNRPNAPMPQGHINRLHSGQEIQANHALQRNEINKLFQEKYLEAENGFCRLDNGSIYTSVLIKMPKVSLDMINWWFWWHAAEGIRYRIWYPEMHYDISINFQTPSDFGFDTKRLNDDETTIICAKVGSPSKGLWFVDMCHFVRVIDDGVEMRSRFWIGHHITKMNRIGKYLARSILNKPFIKRKLIPLKAGSSMFQHCSQEYHNLASFLPQLYDEEHNQESLEY